MAKKKRSRLPRWATTVTPFSKMLALSMLVIFPIIAFYLGMQYQKELALSRAETQQQMYFLPTISPTPTP